MLITKIQSTLARLINGGCLNLSRRGNSDLQKMRNPEVEQLANCDDEDCLSESTPALAFHPPRSTSNLSE